jgi:arsenate reductase (glutaredoxin)
MPVTIYHNPRCSKSRQTLEILEENGVEPSIVEYLETPPDAETLKTILNMLNISAKQLLRTQEDEFKQAGFDKEGLKNDRYSEDQIIKAMIAFPKLIERPIVVSNGKAIIGRPPSLVLDIIE